MACWCWFEKRGTRGGYISEIVIDKFIRVTTRPEVFLHLCGSVREISIVRADPAESKKLTVWYCSLAVIRMEWRVMKVVMRVSFLKSVAFLATETHCYYTRTWNAKNPWFWSWQISIACSLNLLPKFNLGVKYKPGNQELVDGHFKDIRAQKLPTHRFF